MPSPVLTHKIPQVSAEAHVSDGRFFHAPSLDGEVLEEYEAFAVDEFGADRREEGRKSRKGEIGLYVE